MSNEITKGSRVYFGRRRGEKTLGIVRGVNPTRYKVEQLEARGTMKDHPIGTMWRVAKSLVTLVEPSSTSATVPAPTAKRPEAVILREIAGIYGALSPENISCDGELSAAEIHRTSAALNRRLEKLFVELGRRVGESEACGFPA